jgi:5-methylthioadenosine/S-adenosylhomocysteine deaminase
MLLFVERKGTMDDIIGRRGLVKSLAALGVTTRVGSPDLTAGEQQNRRQLDASPGRLPFRGEFIVQNAYVLPMDPELGDIPDGDVHVRNGEIIAVGTQLKAPGAAVLDGHGMILLPGLIDTHWHMWTTFLRCMAGDRMEDGYFPLTTRYGQAMSPLDMYHSTRLAAAEAVYSGLTTVGDNCHNVRSHDHAVADILALKEVGVRCRWSYGPFRGIQPGQRIDLIDLERFHRDWANYSNEGLISLGLMWGGVPDNSGFAQSTEIVDTARKEVETARRLGIPMCIHLAARENTPAGQIEAQMDFLGKDLLLIHALAASKAEMKMVARAGSPISVSPGAELRIGYGLTKACDFMDAGIVVSVSVDNVSLTGNANFFAILKLLRNAENAKAFNEFKISARRVLEMGTIDGARALGIDHLVGSLKPGKRADLIMVMTNRISMGVFTDPTHMLVEATEEADVDTVVIDGRILKRDGKFTALVPEQVIAAAAASLHAVGKRANALQSGIT